MSRAGRYTIIENPAAYEAAIERRIKQNANIGRAKRMEAAFPGLRDRVLADTRVLPTWVRDAIFDWGALTEKQARFALDALDRNLDKSWDLAIAEQERRANTTPWTAGRQVVSGKIVSTKFIEQQFGYHATSVLKGLLVTTENRKLWLTIPSAFAPNTTADQMKGMTMTVKVTVQPKDSDPTFAFGSRPSLVKETA